MSVLKRGNVPIRLLVLFLLTATTGCRIGGGSGGSGGAASTVIADATAVAAGGALAVSVAASQDADAATAGLQADLEVRGLTANTDYQLVAPASRGLSAQETRLTTARSDAAGVAVFRGLTLSNGQILDVKDMAGVKRVTLTIAVTGEQQAANRAPTANAGSSQTVTIGAQVTLSGSGTDPDGDTLTYAWVVQSGTGVTLAGAGAATATFTAPAAGTFVFRLTVTDSKGLSSVADVTVTVSAPVLSTANVSTLIPARPKTLSLNVQAAFNATDGQMFWKFSWAGNKGRAHDYYTYKSGAWKRDGDQFRNLEGFSASSESRVTFLVNDPTDTKAVRNFGRYGCFMVCHDSSQNMPDFASGGVSGEPPKRLPAGSLYATARLDLWHWRGHRSNPIGYSDDQWVNASGRNNDTGTSIYSTNGFTSGHPDYVFKSSTTAGGKNATPFDTYSTTSPDYYFTKGLAGHPQETPYTTATAAGYVPAEGDTVPRRRLGSPTASRADIRSAIGNQVSSYEDASGRWNVFLKRAMATRNTTDDVDLVAGNSYEIGFAVHTDNAGNRDHYVSLPVKVGLGTTNADLNAVTVTGGAGAVPDFTLTGTYPVTVVKLFLPGVTSWEYLTDTRTNAFVLGTPHAGASTVNAANTGDAALGCVACHSRGGSLDLEAGTLPARRGGVLEHTPISFGYSVKPALEARCLPCHKEGGTASRFSLGSTSVVTDTAYMTIRSTASTFLNYSTPTASPMLTVPAKNSDGKHAATGSLAGFANSTDYNKLLYWILFNAPKN